MNASPYGGGRLLVKGAEANLRLRRWYGRQVIVKERVRKSYRVPELDITIRRSRTIHESRLLHKAKLAGVATPTVLFVDLHNATIIMEYVRGDVLKNVLGRIDRQGRLQLFRGIGRLIARLHKNDIVHGDLTTSNIIVTPRGTVYLIDFGLASTSPKIEDKAVDLHLFKTVLRSTHHQVADECFNSLIAGYGEVMGDGPTSAILTRMEEIERRGRYVRLR